MQQTLYNFLRETSLKPNDMTTMKVDLTLSESKFKSASLSIQRTDKSVTYTLTTDEDPSVVLLSTLASNDDVRMAYGPLSDTKEFRDGDMVGAAFNFFKLCWVATNCRFVLSPLPDGQTRLERQQRADSLWPVQSKLTFRPAPHEAVVRHQAQVISQLRDALAEAQERADETAHDMSAELSRSAVDTEGLRSALQEAEAGATRAEEEAARARAETTEMREAIDRVNAALEEATEARDAAYADRDAALAALEEARGECGAARAEADGARARADELAGRITFIEQEGGLAMQTIAGLQHTVDELRAAADDRVDDAAEWEARAEEVEAEAAGLRVTIEELEMENGALSDSIEAIKAHVVDWRDSVKDELARRDAVIASLRRRVPDRPVGMADLEVTDVDLGGLG